ncbi:MAG TPA: SpoIVB peptidase S55 domain-containing protein [Candidatus Limnocylindria bacterium]|nr:SpoIVB peptidase S55 domain-containing protein [Candidatus Limnocylindria bacterium]
MNSRLARRRAWVALLALLFLGGSFGAAAPAAAAEPPLPGECPQVKPLREVAIGQRGNGWTVETAKQRERFRFEVLGVIADGIGAGRDLLVVEVFDTVGNDMIARAGGIWAGMSGSPVYLGGELLGAVAYGFTAGPSRIGGVTPAADMLRLLELTPTSAALAGPETVSVPTALRQSLAQRTGQSAALVSTFERLPVPVAASGLNARARNHLQRSLDRRGLSSIVVPASSAARSSAVSVSQRPRAGGNFASVISYGDVTLAGTGTTTYVCGTRALAFGHPFTWVGRSTYGANDARALGVVRDPAFGSFKLANVGGLFGRLDQDRLAGIRAALNATPTLRPITSRVTDAGSGRVRRGRTDVTMDVWVPEVAPMHLVANADSIIDRIGPGSSHVSWTIIGRRANGSPWQLAYANRYSSQFDITFESVFQLAEQLAIIQGNEFEAVRFTGVDIRATFADAYRQWAVERVRVSRNGGPFRDRTSINVAPGDRLDLRVFLRPYRGEAVRVGMSLRVPAGAQPGGGYLLIGSAPDIGGEEATPRTFRQLLNQLAATPRNNVLTASLQLFDFEGGTTTRNRNVALNSIVVGFFELEVNVQ